jgi:type II secretory pathway component GspD/PulD (secretin)
LRDILLLGRLFRNTQTDSQVAQLYIIIRPVILDIWGEDIMSQEQDFRRGFQQLQKNLDKKTEDAELEVDPFTEFRELIIDRASPN